MLLILASVDTDILAQLLPLGDSVIGAGVTIFTALFTYFVGRRRSHQELQNLEAEKRSIEAASGVTTAEAAQILTQAAAATVQPLLERLKEQREEVLELAKLSSDRRYEIDKLRNELAQVKAENELIKKLLPEAEKEE